MELFLLLPLIVSFVVTLIFMPIWINKAKQINLVWQDMNKKGFPKNVAGSGGLIVLLGFILGVLLYIAVKTFILNDKPVVIEIFALLMTVTIASIIGFVDDIFGWAKGGLPKKTRMLLLLISAIPLMVINAGESKMMSIEFGLLYPLFFIPLGVVGCTSTYNFLAGYNGLEARQGIIILSALAVVTYFTGSHWLSLVSAIMVFCLLAFYLFNKYPAKVFPGDVLTYSVGALIASIAILGNIEKIAVFFFIPYIIETILKSRGKLRKHSFGKVKNNGSLDEPYDKIYGLEHLSIRILKNLKKEVYERDVVTLINLFQIIVIIAGFILFGETIF